MSSASGGARGARERRRRGWEKEAAEEREAQGKGKKRL